MSAVHLLYSGGEIPHPCSHVRNHRRAVQRRGEMLKARADYEAELAAYAAALEHERAKPRARPPREELAREIAREVRA